MSRTNHILMLIIRLSPSLTHPLSMPPSGCRLTYFRGKAFMSQSIHSNRWINYQILKPCVIKTQKILCDRSSWGPTEHIICQLRLFFPQSPYSRCPPLPLLLASLLWGGCGSTKVVSFRILMFPLKRDEDLSEIPVCCCWPLTLLQPRVPPIHNHSQESVRRLSQTRVNRCLLCMSSRVSGMLIGWSINWRFHTHTVTIQKTFAVSFLHPFFCGYVGEKDPILVFSHHLIVHQRTN